MSKILLIIVAAIGILVALGYKKYDEITRPLPLPELKHNRYWGPGDSASYKEDTTIKNFKVHADLELIEDLRLQLNRSYQFTEPLEGIKFEYGFNSDALQQYVDYWRDDYLPRWSEREEYFNKLPQYTTQIQGLKIHFIHAKPDAEVAKNKTVLPLLLLHGWPGSVREFYDFIPLLTQPSIVGDFVYEVIAPSLVGYGWSDASAKVGFNAAEMAIVMRNLMLRIGHQKFLVQGGDWGSIIGSNIATIFPNNVIGYHSNMCVMHTPLFFMKNILADFFPDKFLPTRFFYNHHFPLKEKLMFLLQESGYFHIQATKPDTIGLVLSQSPAGLAAYILEKFQTATKSSQFDALSTTFTVDAMFDNIMAYYITNTATSAARFYAENMSKAYLGLQLERVQTPVPMGCARFINDLPSAMDWQLLDKYPNLKHSKYFHQGGHFAALEVPVMLYIDFNEFVAKIEF